MSKLLKVLGIAAMVGLSAPAKASAVTVFNWSGCGGASFMSCATVVANWDAGSSTLILDVTNTNPNAGWTGVIARLGFTGIGGTINTATSSATGAGSWSFSNSLNAISAYAGAQANPAPTNNGLADGESAQFTIKYSVAPNWNAASFSFGLHEISADDYWKRNEIEGCSGSNKLFVTKTGETYTPNTVIGGGACWPDDPPTDVVPEPATMVLLATGLIGLAGAQLRRRKNTKV